MGPMVTKMAAEVLIRDEGEKGCARCQGNPTTCCGHSCGYQSFNDRNNLPRVTSFDGRAVILSDTERDASKCQHPRKRYLYENFQNEECNSRYDQEHLKKHVVQNTHSGDNSNLVQTLSKDEEVRGDSDAQNVFETFLTHYGTTMPQNVRPSLPSAVDIVKSDTFVSPACVHGQGMPYAPEGPCGCGCNGNSYLKRMLVATERANKGAVDEKTIKLEQGIPKPTKLLPDPHQTQLSNNYLGSGKTNNISVNQSGSPPEHVHVAGPSPTQSQKQYSGIQVHSDSGYTQTVTQSSQPPNPDYYRQYGPAMGSVNGGPVVSAERVNETGPAQQMRSVNGRHAPYHEHYLRDDNGKSYETAPSEYCRNELAWEPKRKPPHALPTHHVDGVCLVSSQNKSTVKNQHERTWGHVQNSESTVRDESHSVSEPPRLDNQYEQQGQWSGPGLPKDLGPPPLIPIEEKSYQDTQSESENNLRYDTKSPFRSYRNSNTSAEGKDKRFSQGESAASPLDLRVSDEPLDLSVKATNLKVPPAPEPPPIYPWPHVGQPHRVPTPEVHRHHEAPVRIRMEDTNIGRHLQWQNQRVDQRREPHIDRRDVRVLQNGSGSYKPDLHVPPVRNTQAPEPPHYQNNPVSSQPHLHPAYFVLPPKPFKRGRGRPRTPKSLKALEDALRMKYNLNDILCLVCNICSAYFTRVSTLYSHFSRTHEVPLCMDYITVRTVTEVRGAMQQHGLNNTDVQMMFAQLEVFNAGNLKDPNGENPIKSTTQRPGMDHMHRPMMPSWAPELVYSGAPVVPPVHGNMSKPSHGVAYPTHPPVPQAMMGVPGQTAVSSAINNKHRETQSVPHAGIQGYNEQRVPMSSEQRQFYDWCHQKRKSSGSETVLDMIGSFISRHCSKNDHMDEGRWNSLYSSRRKRSVSPGTMNGLLPGEEDFKMRRVSPMPTPDSVYIDVSEMSSESCGDSSKSSEDSKPQKDGLLCSEESSKPPANESEHPQDEGGSRCESRGATAVTSTHRKTSPECEYVIDDKGGPEDVGCHTTDLNGGGELKEPQFEARHSNTDVIADGSGTDAPLEKVVTSSNCDVNPNMETCTTDDCQSRGDTNDNECVKSEPPDKKDDVISGTPEVMYTYSQEL